MQLKRKAIMYSLRRELDASLKDETEYIREFRETVQPKVRDRTRTPLLEWLLERAPAEILDSDMHTLAAYWKTLDHQKNWFKLNPAELSASYQAEVGLEPCEMSCFHAENIYRSAYEPKPLRDRVDTPLKRWLLEHGADPESLTPSHALYMTTVRTARKDLVTFDSKRVNM